MKIKTFLASAVLLAGIGQAALAADVIKIGVVGPFTGPSAKIGQDIQNGTKMALDDARAAGELPLTIDGKKADIQLVWIDDESSPEKAVKAYRNAVSREGIQMLLNGWHGSVGLALIDLAASDGIISYGNLAAPEDISEKINAGKYTNWFKGWPAPKTMSGLYVEAAEDLIAKGKWTPPTRKAAVVVEDSDWGRTWGEAIVTGLKAKGWDVVAQDVARNNELEFNALLTRYKASGVSLTAFTLNAPASAAAFVKQFHSAGLKGLLFADGLGWASNWHELTGDAANFALSMDSPRVITPEEKEWTARFEKTFGMPPVPAAGGHAYDYTRALIKGMSVAGTLDTTKLSAALLATEHKGIWQYYAFARQPGDAAISAYEVKAGPFMKGFSFPMVQYYGDKAPVVWPFEFAEAEFKAPN
ncbi:ABC transporter substrate-binding protein [Ancylobacter amanitiformis]|uniref:Branched-chain amino acid transport system substrate-binding protein n=1 Tax=Ancylobacter amanitiformis TaxID=217069 RepID=A0ABU0LLP7_9HYPH|nr:ABC transporter substrate-binding protein [Ancylobacter amanitiformis]MDQ0509629.1 branched-chain amino acid transport system substrate-binding protein [Ancylobacter amanitiformis]